MRYSPFYALIESMWDRVPPLGALNMHIYDTPLFSDMANASDCKAGKIMYDPRTLYAGKPPNNLSTPHSYDQYWYY